MAVVRWVAVALFVVVLAGGCQNYMKNDPIMGDHPWQPGSPPPQKFSTTTPASSTTTTATQSVTP